MIDWKQVKSEFYINEGVVYLDGNSLGLCSKPAEAKTLEVMEVWKQSGIDIWQVQDGKYFLYPSFLAKKLAPLIGADPTEVTIANSTTVNIHQAIATFYQPTHDRYKILVDELNFPSDIHAVKSQLRLQGYFPDEALKVVKSRDGKTLATEDILEAMTEDVALVLLPAVLYRSAQLLDLDTISAAGRERGIIVGWDLCHSIGAIDHNFSRTQPDFAIWCNYKYLSAGPGAIGGMYVNSRHLDKEVGLAGWQGGRKATMFQMDHTHDPSPDADRFLIGTPSILAMAGLEGVLELYERVGMERVRARSLELTRYLMDQVDQHLSEFGFQFGNPMDDAKRGGHVALEHDKAYQICQALKAAKVIPDFREPNVIRLAPVALYVDEADIDEFVKRLESIMKDQTYLDFAQEKGLVV